jgi:glycosyltransferase involved in cell wall biosynthesis
MPPESTAPARVLLLTDADVFAGTEQHILMLACALRRKQIDVFIGCPQPSPLADRASTAGIAVIALPKRGRVDWRAAGTIRRLVKSGRIKIVHAHNGRTTLAAAIALRGLKSARLVVTQHFLAPAHTKRRGVAGVVSRILHDWLNHRTNKTIAISQAVADSMRDRGEFAPSAVTVVHNGLPKPALDHLKPAATVRAELAIDPAAPLIVCAARLEPEKDVASLIAAMPRLLHDFPAARCVIAGRGSLQESLAQQITDLHLDQQVRLLGFHSDVLSLMAAADVVVMPSLAEPFGLVLLEAMSLGRPVVATRAGGPLEIVADGVTGLLIPPADPPALSAALARLIANPAEARAMGQAARDRFEQLFTDEHMAGAIADLYRELVK